jgi:hypothetical protein
MRDRRIPVTDGHSGVGLVLVGRLDDSAVIVLWTAL